MIFRAVYQDAASSWQFCSYIRRRTPGVECTNGNVGESGFSKAKSTDCLIVQSKLFALVFNQLIHCLNVHFLGKRLKGDYAIHIINYEIRTARESRRDIKWKAKNRITTSKRRQLNVLWEGREEVKVRRRDPLGRVPGWALQARFGRTLTNRDGGTRVVVRDS